MAPCSASKLLMAGHAVSLVCRRETAELINREGTRVRMPVKGREGLVEIDSRELPGKLDAVPRPRPSPSSTTWSAWPCRSRSTAPPACAS